MRRSRLRWHGSVLRNGDNYLMNKCMECDVEGVKSKGRPNKTRSFATVKGTVHPSCLVGVLCDIYWEMNDQQINR